MIQPPALSRVENLAELREDNQRLLFFFEDQRRSGVTVTAIAKRLEMSRENLYKRLKVARKQRAKQLKKPGSPTTGNPAPTQPEGESSTSAVSDNDTSHKPSVSRDESAA